MVQLPRWQMILATLIVLLGFAYAAPNVMDDEVARGLPDWLPSQKINLGVDLQGGTYLLVEAAVEEAVARRMAASGEALAGVLAASGIGNTGHRVEGQEIFLRIDRAADLERAKDIARDLEPDLLVFGSGNRLKIEFPDDRLREFRGRIMQQVSEVLRRRLDEFGLLEASLQRQGDDRVLVQIPGLKDAEPIKKELKKATQLSFQFVNTVADPDARRAPFRHEILPSRDEAGVSYVLEKAEIVTGESLDNAQASFDEYGQAAITFRFDTLGAAEFAKATRDNVGRNFAIVLDDEVISAPVIREPILGGSGQITGGFTVEEAENLAKLLRAGALPADLTYLDERSVGPSLGEDSVNAGAIASVLGLILVIVFVALTYGSFGLMASAALLANLVLIVALLSALQATLTLPGIAGIGLTIGMAVDANVLIFERIREEKRPGRGPVGAIDNGYRRALTTIIDANLTTLVAATILFAVGTGPVKGFAITLMIGLMTSLFTAILLTRIFVVGWLKRFRPKALPI